MASCQRKERKYSRLPDPQDDSLFFSVLPPEMRLMVYELVAQPELDEQKLDYRDNFDIASTSRQAIPLLLSCRRVWNEARSVLSETTMPNVLCAANSPGCGRYSAQPKIVRFLELAQQATAGPRSVHVCMDGKYLFCAAHAFAFTNRAWPPDMIISVLAWRIHGLGDMVREFVVSAMKAQRFSPIRRCELRYEEEDLMPFDESNLNLEASTSEAVQQTSESLHEAQLTKQPWRMRWLVEPIATSSRKRWTRLGATGPRIYTSYVIKWTRRDDTESDDET